MKTIMVKTTGETAIAAINQNGDVMAINWGVSHSDEAEFIGEINGGNDMNITDHMLDAPLTMEQAFGSGHRVLASN